MAGITLVYPLDTAKMRLQTHSQYRGLSDCLRTMVREEGWGSLYRGLLSPQVGFGVTFSLSFAANGQATRWIREWHNDPSESSWVGLLSEAAPDRQLLPSPLCTLHGLLHCRAGAHDWGDGAGGHVGGHRAVPCAAGVRAHQERHASAARGRREAAIQCECPACLLHLFYHRWWVSK